MPLSPFWAYIMQSLTPNQGNLSLPYLDPTKPTLYLAQGLMEVLHSCVRLVLSVTWYNQGLMYIVPLCKLWVVCRCDDGPEQRVYISKLDTAEEKFIPSKSSSEWVTLESLNKKKFLSPFLQCMVEQLPNLSTMPAVLWHRNHQQIMLRSGSDCPVILETRFFLLDVSN